MRVLHLYSGNLYGGVETLLATLARCRHLCPDMEPEFGLCFRGRLWDELTATGVPVHDLGPVRTSRPWTVLRARWRLKALLRQRTFDVAVSHSGWPHAIFAPVARRAEVRLALVVHSEVDRRHWINRWAARETPDVVIANSQFIAQQASEWLTGTSPPVQTICYPVVSQTDATFTDRDELRKELDTTSGTVVILQASRLEDWKGQRVFIEALGRLCEVPGWTAWYAGGPQRGGEASFLAELQATARQLRIAKRVRFLGHRTDVPALMRAADIHCQPNTSPEPFGIVFIEALAAGLPVVTSGFGGAAEIIDNTCGILTPPGDSAAVADALRSLIGNSELRESLGRHGPERATRLCDPARQLHRLRNSLLSNVV